MDKFNLFLQTRHPKEVNDYFHTLNLSNILNVIYWNEFLSKISKVDGDIIECGIGRGRSLLTILALNLLHSNNKNNRKIFALDSFEGFPEPHEIDKSARSPKKGDWSQSPNNHFQYSIENLIKIIKCADLGIYIDEIGPNNNDNTDLIIIKGFFEETTKSINTKKIALLHLDGDLYESVKSPLENLSEKISIHGIVVIDDYKLNDANKNNEPFPGARKAVEEFLTKNKNFEIHESLRGTPYLIKKYD